MMRDGGREGGKEVGESKERRGERVFVKGERSRRKIEVGAGNEYGGDWVEDKEGGREGEIKEGGGNKEKSGGKWSQ